MTMSRRRTSKRSMKRALDRIFDDQETIDEGTFRPIHDVINDDLLLGLTDDDESPNVLSPRPPASPRVVPGKRQ